MIAEGQEEDVATAEAETEQRALVTEGQEEQDAENAEDYAT